MTDSLTADASPATIQRRERRVPLIVGCALFMQMLDSTVVATALPAMADSLGSTPLHMSATITAYLLAVAVFVPVSGWAADRYGARRVFLAAIGVFVASSVACSMATSLSQLVAARVFQGLGGAMMVPVGRLILLRSVPRERLLGAMASLSLPALVGPVVGPPLGGLLVTWFSWHWIFLINVPIGLIGLVLVRRHVPEIAPRDAGPLDIPGVLLSAVALATGVAALESVGKGTLPAWLLVALLITGACTAVAYVRHARRTPHPVLDLSLLRIASFRTSVLGGNLVRFAVGSVAFLLAMQLQVGFGYSPVQAGLITFATAVGALLMKLLAPPILQRWGYRNVLTVNALLTGAGVMACALFTDATPGWVMIGVLLLGGFFRSLQFTAVNTLTYADIPQPRMSQASSLASMAQQVGISLGVAIASVTLTVSMVLRGADRLGPADVVAGFLVVGGLSAASALSFVRLAPDAGAALRA